MSDIFDEAEESLRTEKWAQLAKQAAPWAALAASAALLIAVGIWGFSAWGAHQRDKASEAYQAALESMQTDPAKARAGFESITKSGTSAYKAMAHMQIAGFLYEEGKMDEAVAALDAAAAADRSPQFADLAALKAAYIVMDKGNFAETEKRLKPLMAEDRPYAALAAEALALAKFQNGDVQGAKDDLNALSLSLDAPDSLKQRATAQVQAMESGVAPTVKAVLALPAPTAPVITGLPEGLPQLVQP